MNSVKPLVLRDELHGDIAFDGLVRWVIDHPLFQRLRHIKQMGLADYVFPCATHTRFQHSLGTGYMAGQYFTSMIDAWTRSPLRGESKSGRSKVFFSRTRDCILEVAEHPESLDYWSRVACMSGLLHDLGHGPWSHTFERIELAQNFDSGIAPLSGVVRDYFDHLTGRTERFSHEDVSVLYLHHLLQDLDRSGRFPRASSYFLSIAALINKRIAGFDSQRLENELARLYREEGLVGAVDMHRLLRPMISGPFDADRIDYIQRDGRNCGVSIGGVEWRRIVSKLLPCLAEHPSSEGEPRDVVLLSSVKNLHVLDDFIFSLFQMYAQVYMHPKIVGIEEEVQRMLRRRVEQGIDFQVTFETHQKLDDTRFLRLMEERFGVTELIALLSRQEPEVFRVASIPESFVSAKNLGQQGYQALEVHERPMLKDKVGVFLFSSLDSQQLGQDAALQPWAKISPVAQCLSAVSYNPSYWVRRKA